MDGKEAGTKRKRRRVRKPKIVEGLIKIEGVDFILIAADEFLRLGGDEWRLTGLPPREPSENAVATRVREARRHAGLTQVALAERLGKSQTLVSQAESGVARVNARYVLAVLRACGLRRTWGASRFKGLEPPASQGRPGSEGYVVGIDPETCEAVTRGSKRDHELAEKYVWWSNGYTHG